MIITIRLILLLVFLSLSTNTSQIVYAKGNNNNNVKEACSVTRYQNLCIHTLAQFSNTAGRTPSKWARAGVSVTISEVKNVQAYLTKLKKNGKMKGRNRVALSDCIETFGYAVDELHKSLGVLRKLSKNTFSTQMGDLNTWISAALTNEDTCLDGFEGKTEKKIKLLQNKVKNVSYITSNALALVNKLASTGLEFIGN
ncbi:putative pectinesterase [Medicago truncatula]|uniref:Plant invertase/pectin methylesterase inhibitor n=1 Tax=Medicago truncatula TaxID=3880 RepID=G7LBZ5_MEDTR|nr:pectinesterase inhibitor 6 [Medicago truncatula]AES82139.1 plant invertase/pectin methylesterase inhibitor [Medicago truncatula]RHN48957.1 putative pectinesterase [Medicago truncatula]